MSQATPEPSPTEIFSRYARLIEATLRQAKPPDPLNTQAEDARHVQVERGVVFPLLLADPLRSREPIDAVQRLIISATPAQVERFVVNDSSGHSRPVYRPLLIYSWLQAFSLGYELLPQSEFGRWEEALRVWCDDLEASLGEFIWPAEGIPAELGDRTAEACWTALALQVAGKVYIRDAWIDLAGDVFGKLTKRQREDGSFLTGDLSDNPETRWYHELVILHAAASRAVQAEDRPLAQTVAKATEFHLRETQPDHATNQPWALFAFLWNSATRSVADALLHNPSLNATGEAGAAPSHLTLTLLADALYCLKLFGV